CDSSKCAGRSSTDDHGIDVSIHLLEDFDGGGLVVVVGVGGIFELRGHKSVRVTRSQLARAIDGSLHALVIRGSRDLGAEGSHDHNLFLRKSLWYEKRDFVTAIDPDQRQTDAGVAGSCFDNCAAGAKLALFLGPIDDPDCRAIFHTSTGIQIFELGIDFRSIRRDHVSELEKRSPADELGDVVGNRWVRTLDCFLHSTGYGTEELASTPVTAIALDLDSSRFSYAQSACPCLWRVLPHELSGIHPHSWAS